MNEEQVEAQKDAGKPAEPVEEGATEQQAPEVEAESPVSQEQAAPESSESPETQKGEPESKEQPSEQDQQDEEVAKPAAAKPEVKRAPRQRRVAAKRTQLSPAKPKEERIGEMRRHDKDVGSTEVQIGLLTDRILHLTEHLKIHPKDKHTNYGLRKLVTQRKRLLDYLTKTKPETCKKVKQSLGLR